MFCSFRVARTSTNSWIFFLFFCEETKERNTVKPSGKRLKLDETVDDEDLQSAISAIVAIEHSEAVSTVTTEVQESDD